MGWGRGGCQPAVPWPSLAGGGPANTGPALPCLVKGISGEEEEGCGAGGCWRDFPGLFPELFFFPWPWERFLLHPLPALKAKVQLCSSCWEAKAEPPPVGAALSVLFPAPPPAPAGTGMGGSVELVFVSFVCGGVVGFF